MSPKCALDNFERMAEAQGRLRHSEVSEVSEVREVSEAERGVASEHIIQPSAEWLMLCWLGNGAMRSLPRGLAERQGRVRAYASNR